MGHCCQPDHIWTIGLNLLNQLFFGPTLIKCIKYLTFNSSFLKAGTDE